MRAENSRHYPSTKFRVLSDAQSVNTARKNYIILITIVTVLFCMTCTYFLIKTFILPSDTNDQTFSITDHTVRPHVKFYNPKPVLGRLIRKTGWEFSCEESQPRLQAVPEVFIKRMFEQNFENIYDYINLDLLLHYENLISENRASRLKAIFNDYQLKLSLVRNSKDFIKFLQLSNSNKLKFYASYLKKRNLELKKFEGVFALTDELNHWYNYLSKLDAFLSGYEQQKTRRFLNVTVTNIREFIEETQKHLLYFEYPFNITEKKQQEVKEIISEWSKPIKIGFSNSSLSFRRNVILLSDIRKELRNLNVSGLKSAYFFASHTIYLDDDIELPGVDLAIIAPNWVYIKRTKINLNGPDGRNMISIADPEQPGKPGYPGGNAGDFLGVGDPHEKYLLITANGGKGGNGQNGAKGRNGDNNAPPDPPVEKPKCAIKVSTFKNRFGQKITHYKVYSRSGCGGSGTDGGVGGKGGIGGTITLIGRNQTRSTKGSNGMTGSPGKGGAGGVGGRDGCFYEVLDVDDETLHRVTRVKCSVGIVLPSGSPGRDNHNTRGQILPQVKENLQVDKLLLQYIQFVGEEFHPSALPVLEQLMQSYVFYETNVSEIITEYKLLEKFNKLEFYNLFNEQLEKYKHPPTALKYLKAIVLGQITILKQNINFYHIDYKNYINNIKNSIRHTNKDTRVLEQDLYLKQKLEIKRKPMKKNLKKIEYKLIDLYGKIIENSPEKMENLCEYIGAIDVMQFLLNETVKHLELKDLFKSCSEINREIYTKLSLTSEKKIFLGILKNLKDKEDVRRHLEKLKDVFCCIKDPDEVSNQEKIILEALTDELEHFIALYYFIEWEETENLFSESLHELNESSKEGDGMDFLKTRLLDVIIYLQYNAAVNAARQNVYPFDKKLELFRNESLIDDALTDLSFLEYKTNERFSFCGNKLEAVFDRRSVVGEFYFWPNEEIQKALRVLFSGAEINLKSSLFNRHVFDKNFLQFKRIKLEFECIRNENICQKQLNGVLANFKIELVHSGYSYYNWKEKTRVVISEKVGLVYSFRTRDDNEPEIYNEFYKKCRDGEIKLSPFTTWTVRLLPITKDSNFNEFSSFADNVNLRLIGTGTYAS